MHQLHPGGKRSSQYHDGLGGREDVSLLVDVNNGTMNNGNTAHASYPSYNRVRP